MSFICSLASTFTLYTACTWQWLIVKSQPYQVLAMYRILYVATISYCVVYAVVGYMYCHVHVLQSMSCHVQMHAQPMTRCPIWLPANLLTLQLISTHSTIHQPPSRWLMYIDAWQCRTHQSVICSSQLAHTKYTQQIMHALHLLFVLGIYIVDVGSQLTDFRTTFRIYIATFHSCAEKRVLIPFTVFDVHFMVVRWL